MLQSVGSCSPALQLTHAASQAASDVTSPAAAVSKAILDILSISSQGQAASTKLDADGDGDGH